MAKKKTNKIQDAGKAAVDAVNKSKNQLRKALEKNAKELRKSIEGNTKNIRKTFQKNVDALPGQAQKVSLDAMIGAVNLHKKAFDSAFGAIAKLDAQAEKAIQQSVKKANWMPSEAKEVVDDWAKMLKEGRSDFQKTMDKSFDHITKFLKRVQKDGAKSPAKKSGGSANRKRVTVKKKAAPKKKATAKKKTTAKKKSAAKKKATA